MKNFSSKFVDLRPSSNRFLDFRCSPIFSPKVHFRSRFFENFLRFRRSKFEQNLNVAKFSNRFHCSSRRRKNRQNRSIPLERRVVARKHVDNDRLKPKRESRSSPRQTERTNTKSNGRLELLDKYLRI